MRDYKKMDNGDLLPIEMGICFFIFVMMFIIVFSGLAYMIYS